MATPSENQRGCLERKTNHGLGFKNPGMSSNKISFYMAVKSFRVPSFWITCKSLKGLKCRFTTFLFKTGHRGSALFSLFSGQQSPYMHPSAELYIPVSDVHPSLAMQITLFSLLRGIKNLEKPKKTKKTTKTKKAEPMSQYLAWGQYFCFFWFFEVKPKKQKKQKCRTYVPVSGMGSVL